MKFRHKKIRILILTLVIAAAVVMGVRIYRVNRADNRTVIENYAQNEKVAIGKNIFQDETENMNGYAVTVKESEIMDTEAFVEAFCDGEMPDADLPVKVLAVRVIICNDSLTEDVEAGMNLIYYRVAGDDIYLPINYDLYEYANRASADGSVRFMLRPDSEKEFILPFGSANLGVSEEALEKAVKSRELYLPVCLYPVQKQIQLDIGG